MRTRIILATVLLSCSHSKEVEDETLEEEPQQEQREKDTRPPAEEGRPELSTSAQALLLPEGPRLIQEALAERGFLAPDHQTGKLDKETSAALRKFQTAEDVARTGYPDRETVRRLGLEVDDVFKATGTNVDTPERRR